LAKAHALARDPRDREHVTLYIKEHPEEFRVAYLNAPESLRYPDLRVTIDTPGDLAFMQRLVSCLPEEDGPIPLREYIPFALGIHGRRADGMTQPTRLKQRECKALPTS
jgi:spore coat polysaccharide biosynthesis protein SpsF